MALYAIDTEMVADINYKSMLARVSVVDRQLRVVLDEYVKPTRAIGDYRTEWSGIRPGYENRARDFGQVLEQLKRLIQGCTVVGHDIQKDLDVLNLNFNIVVKDLATYGAYVRKYGGKPSLKQLAKELLGENIQSGEHDSVEDARATMKIYNLQPF